MKFTCRLWKGEALMQPPPDVAIHLTNARFSPSIAILNKWLLKQPQFGIAGGDDGAP
jgi:hypothetical protein